MRTLALRWGSRPLRLHSRWNFPDSALSLSLRLQQPRWHESEQATVSAPQTNRSRGMNSKLVSAESSSKVSFPSESMPRVKQKDSIKSFVIALLLLVVAFIVFVGTMLVHYPQ